jgi:uncharacterized LabA/DUF88 family protein
MDECQAKCETPAALPRAALYVDGFNLYHPLHETGQPHLKWLDLWKLGERFCAKAKAQLVKVVFCTAVPDEPAEKRDRHNTYNRALQGAGVTILKGHHVYDPENDKRTEKQSDINLALSLMFDAQDDAFDYAFLLTADSDQAATGRFFKERFPEKKLISVAPPNKKPPEKLRPFCAVSFSMSIDDVEACVFGMHAKGATGPIRRPESYCPPEGWVHPDDRPKRKKEKI